MKTVMFFVEAGVSGIIKIQAADEILVLGFFRDVRVELEKM